MSLIGIFAANSGKRAMERAWSRGWLRCPQCAAPPAQAPQDIDTLVRCGSCGSESLARAWFATVGAAAAGHADHKPSGTRIQRECQAHGDCVWQIPASGKFGFFLFFGLFWTTITATVSGGFLLASRDGGSDPYPWFIYPFFSLFWAVGLGMLYAAVRNKYASHRITVTRDLVTLRREMFGRAREKSLTTGQVTSVEQTVFYQQNYQPVYGIEIRGKEGKLRFGTALEDAEKAWLAADIRRAVFGKEDFSPPSVGTPVPVPAERQSSFSFPLPSSPGWDWVFGLVMLLIGLAALAVGIFDDFGFSSGEGRLNDWFDRVFAVLFNLFRLVPILVGLVFAGIGGAFLHNTWNRSGREIRLEGDETQVALRTYRLGRIIREEPFARPTVSRAVASHSGSVNGKSMKRIDLMVDGRAHKLAGWVTGDQADAWVENVNRALGN